MPIAANSPLHQLPPRWLLHINKVPTHNGIKHGHADPQYHRSLNEAQNLSKEIPGAELGFSFDRNSCVIDGDKIINNGEIFEPFLAILRYKPTYTEYSRSEQGIHSHYYLTLGAYQRLLSVHKWYPYDTIRRVEFLREGYFVAVTGNSLPEFPQQIATLNEADIDAILQLIINHEPEKEEKFGDTIRGPLNEIQIKEYHDQIISGEAHHEPAWRLTLNLAFNNVEPEQIENQIGGLLSISPGDGAQRTLKKLPGMIKRAVGYAQETNKRRIIWQQSNAQDIAQLVIADLSGSVYHTEIGWLQWDGMRYSFATSQQITNLVVSAFRRHANKLKELLDFGKEDDLKLIKQLDRFVANIIAGPSTFVSYIQGFAERALEDFDNQPLLLNMPNGIFDATTNTIIPHNKKFLLTQLTNVIADPYMPTPIYDKFIADLSCNDAALSADFLNFKAYCLFGLINEHICFVLYGEGANGKTTLINVLEHILISPGMQSYCTSWRNDMLEEKTSASVQDYALAAARTARIVICPEISEKKLNMARLKLVTAGDRTPARAIYGRPFSYNPTFKLVLITNHIISVDPDDYAAMRRLRIIPFNARFVSEPNSKNDKFIDKFMMDKLKKEAPGILYKLCARGHEIVKLGHLPEFSTAIKHSTNIMKSENDSIQRFVDECLNDEDELARISLGELYDSFNDWNSRNTNGKIQFSQMVFSKRLLTKITATTTLCSYKKKKKQVVLTGWQLNPNLNAEF